MYNQEKMLLDMGYIKAERCIAKPVILGRSGSTVHYENQCYCPSCGYGLERRSLKNTTALVGKTYKEFCRYCGQLLEIPYR